MSFSFTVKEEIVQSISNKDKEKAFLYGLLSFCKTFSSGNIVIQTENEVVANVFKNQVKKVTNNENSVAKTIKKKRNSACLYSLSIEDIKDRQAIFDYYGMDFFEQKITIEISKIGKKKYINYFVAGAFLACGSVNDPMKEYHLEFVTSSDELCKFLGDILFESGITTKHTIRKNYYILYIKESENIEDILTFMGAPKSSLEIMNVKILKDVRNKINRAVNWDNANIEKTLQAAETQIEDIELIDEKMGLENLPDELRDIAILRLENPDWNLKELAQNINPPISRSGANHRLARIKKIAEGLKFNLEGKINEWHYFQKS